MAVALDNLVIELKNLTKTIFEDGFNGDSSSTMKPGLLKLLTQAGLVTNSVSEELKDIIAAFTLQNTYTNSTLGILNSLQPSTTFIVTIETLRTATNLIQIYFQVTEPLEQILSDLIDNLPSPLTGTTLTDIQTSIQRIKTDREKLREAQTNALQEFGDVLDELDLEKLVQKSNTIRTEFENLSTSLPSPIDFSNEIEFLINHLGKADKFFKDFSENNGNLTGREPNQIKTLIRNWGESVALIETIEQTDPIRRELSDPDKSRSAIAQSIKIHDLLETNYDYLTALVRSIDLVSAGSL
jgi:hypothetical protein